uniref:Transport protein n=1 Tax=Caenorhabditis tropicalis TaxID=1561998 RepID=A0A1I7V2X8_9PELO
MQRQLFHSLIAQTLFPIFLMFIPAGIVLCFPILRTDMGPIEVIILPLITTQPFMDAIVPLYYIKDYRMAILRCVRRTKRSVRIHQASHIDDRSRTSRVFSLRT